MQRFLKQTLATCGVALLLVSFGCGLTSCGGRKGWNEMQRKEARQMLRQWRDMVYLRNMDEMEFATFATEVTDILEEQYPSYVEFILDLRLVCRQLFFELGDACCGAFVLELCCLL